MVETAVMNEMLDLFAIDAINQVHTIILNDDPSFRGIESSLQQLF